MAHEEALGLAFCTHPCGWVFFRERAPLSSKDRYVETCACPKLGY